MSERYRMCGYSLPWISSLLATVGSTIGSGIAAPDDAEMLFVQLIKWTSQMRIGCWRDGEVEARAFSFCANESIVSSLHSGEALMSFHGWENGMKNVPKCRSPCSSQQSQYSLKRKRPRDYLNKLGCS